MHLFARLALFSVLAFFANSAMARQALPEDLGAVLEFDRTNIDVKADGLYRIEREFQIRIINDQGREAQSEQSLPFNARASKIKILSARVITGDKTIDVPKQNIETREVGQNVKIFDTQKQIVVSFPNVRLESRLYLKYEMTMTEVPIAGHFSFVHNSEGSTAQEQSFEIRSDKPLHAFLNDPGKYYSLSERKDGKRFVYILKNTKPFDLAVVQEDYFVTEPERIQIATFSTDKDWSQFGGELPGQVEGLLSAPLPEEMKRIVAQIDGQAPVVDRLNKVTALMSEEFRYFGDWRRRNGGHLPRSLAEIAQSRYGDCKDLSLAAAAIYRALGFKAHQAWIFRSPGLISPAFYTLPVDNFFNHAIVRVEAEGKTYWIDPTNPVSFAQGIPEDIADRSAFVLDTAAARLEQTPTLRSAEENVEISLKYELLKDLQVQATGTVQLRGRSAIGLTTNNFFNSSDNVNYELVRFVSASDRLVSFEVGEFERKSRIVKDLRIPLKFLLEDIGMRTTAGLGFPIMREGLVNRLLVDARNRKSGIWLTTPKVIGTRYEIVNVKKVGTTSLDCEIDSPWAKLSRRVQSSKSGVAITDRIENHKILISLRDLRTPEFATFQKKVRECFLRSALILQRQ